MGTRAIKQKVLKTLRQDDLARIETELAVFQEKALINALFSGICHSDERIRWHAISVMGGAVARLAEQDMEEARIILRRMLWSLNDESGGIGWGAPESMAEIICRHEGLADEYVHLLISYMRPDGEEEWQDGNFLEHEMLQQGLLWAVGRLAQCRKEHLLSRRAERDLPPYLDAEDATVRGLAARAIGLLGLPGGAETVEGIEGIAVKERLRELAENDQRTLRFYEQGEFRTVSVAELAKQALETLQDVG
ncbi:MAG: HEAT repeat domain-containing protein [Candidatus Electrothrix sp. AUS1_2]|nr:HEAT repeat domain-containing protein [Candidatus Electrothrix sp. AUS1_2]